MTDLSEQTHFYVDASSVNIWCAFFLRFMSSQPALLESFFSVILVAGSSSANSSLLIPDTRAAFCGLPSMPTWLRVVCRKAIASCLRLLMWSTFLKHYRLKSRTNLFLSPFLLQNFLASTSCPEIQGYLYVKELGRKSWKKVYMFLRRSGLYCSTKGTSKVQATRSFHLQRAELI